MSCALVTLLLFRRGLADVGRGPAGSSWYVRWYMVPTYSAVYRKSFDACSTPVAECGAGFHFQNGAASGAKRW